MNFRELFSRADLTKLSSYLLVGSDYLAEPPQGTYAERLKEAEREADEFFKERFPDKKEYDRAVECFFSQVAVHQDIYFELGLMMGAKVALQFNKRVG